MFVSKYCFFYFKDCEDECIIPLVENKHRHEIMTLSIFGELDYDDIISNTNDLDFLSNCFNVIIEHYRGFTFQIENVRSDSLFYSIAGQYDSERKPCVAIPLPVSFDLYISGVSKHQQQNIRTTFNRLKRENFDYFLECYDSDNEIHSSLWNECQLFYEQRYWNYKTDSTKRRDRRRSILYNQLNSIEVHRVFVLFHKSTPIAYMAGWSDLNRKSYLVPRLCINGKYSHFSPGIILLVEVIKKLIIEQYEILDLMLGDEQYKLSMGGVVHYTHKILCKS